MKRILALLLLTSIITACRPTPAPQTPTQPVEASPAASSKPEAWWRDAVFYEVFVRSFNDSNGDGIGGFNGLIQKLDYIQSLGVTAIWLMPIHPSPSYHGYDVLNYYAVNPDYGTMADFKHLLDEAHKRGIKIIIDLVLNHTSSQHPFFVDALHGPASKYYDWYIWSDKNQGNHWHSVMGDMSKYYFGIFCDCMPDLNYNNPQVTAQMQDVTRFWLNNVGVDGFRMDAINRLIEDGSKTENTPATHTWLKGFYTSYKADNPNAYAIGEVYGADASLAKTYTGDQLDEVFNFEIATGILNSVKGVSNIGINSALTFATQTLPDGNYGTFLTNHDQDRVMSVLGGDTNKAKLAAFLMLTSPGTPFIYYGEEIGMQGEKPDEDIRRPMQWDNTTNAGFTTGNPWRAPADDFSTVNVAAQTNDPNSLLSFYRDLISLRKQKPALRTGKIILLDTGNTGVYASLRTDGTKSFLILANLKNERVKDYSLTLKSSALAEGTYSLAPLYGSGNFGSLQMNAGGTFGAYQPLAEIPPYGMYILQVTPTK
ncbi:MAG: alpha-amylase family glycosyl hydrolase [Chloroflexi bacterium]|nr:alpha-amylase family glycosyl hydrolase [Chloroflexota bacterium]